MRYEDWDVLLFPKDSKVPMKEFKVQCHVVHDNEFAFTQGSYGLPTMTCFTPGLPTGSPFNISLHCWKSPEISQFTKNFSNHTNLVKFEARIFIDHRMVATSSFSRTGPWPQLVNRGFEFTKNGELEYLKFPSFRSELLRQNYWSPADGVGRIKIVISEGFPRDSLTVPIERVKNVVAFSFQHAPIDILETSAIAWPNPTMWRRGPFNPTLPIAASEQPNDGAESHIHSPRHRSDFGRSNNTSSSGYDSTVPGMGSAHASNFFGPKQNTQAILQRSALTGTASSSTNYMDPFSHPHPVSESTSYLDWANTDLGLVGYNPGVHITNPTYNLSAPQRQAKDGKKAASSNFSIPDYTLDSNSFQNMVELQQLNCQGIFQEDPDTSSTALQVPTNTPTTLPSHNFVVEDHNTQATETVSPGCMSSLSAEFIPKPGTLYNARRSGLLVTHANSKGISGTSPTNDFFAPSNLDANFPLELANSLTSSLLNQHMPIPSPGAVNIPLPSSEMKSRKENRYRDDGLIQNAPNAVMDHIDMRKVSTFASPIVGLTVQCQSQGTDSQSRETSSTNSPRTFSGIFSHCSGSIGNFGKNLTNSNNISLPTKDASTPGASGAMSEPHIGSGMGSGSDKGTKRTRNFTTASSKAIDDEDEPRRSSPRVRIGFGEEMAN